LSLFHLSEVWSGRASANRTGFRCAAFAAWPLATHCAGSATGEPKDKTNSGSAALRAEADIILCDRKLLDILKGYGVPTISGSYALTLSRMQFRNERIEHTQGLPCGPYWSIYFEPSDCQSWKVDIWCVESEECRCLLSHASNILEKLTPDNREIILAIKSECWNHHEYRRGFSSNDIYVAVLDDRVTSVGQFRKYLETNKGISI
jgi:hypothetical protein